MKKPASAYILRHTQGWWVKSW